jgi:aryl-alcohol dehydrogenase-like predicted oxidoreductase/predicted kinase
MRMPPERALETIAAAAGAGVTVFDTARAYEDNEQLVARALRECGAQGRARLVTKGGMSRPGEAWVPDGRAKAIRGDCEASLAALDGLPIDLYLIHAPDPRTPWRTSVRALARLVDEGLVKRVGVANVNRAQLDEALELAPIAAVQVALSVFDESALRGGVVERCAAAGVALIAHSPLGGPRRAKRLDEQQAHAALAWLLDLSPVVVAIPGARRPETARSAAAAASIVLDDDARAVLPARPRRRPTSGDGEVVVVMGIPGAGKTRVAEDYAARGYVRLNRDERGGSLRSLAEALDAELAAGARRVVLDNTYLTRAARSYVLDAAGRHGVAARCVWLDTPLAQAQVNIVERLLDGEEVLAPTSQMRTLRELEPPSSDEGWADVEQVPFARAASTGAPGVFVAAAALEALPDTDGSAPHLVFDWRPGAEPDVLDPEVAALAARISGPVEGAVCPHGAGPPTCWCRPPLPRLILEFARRRDVDPARSTLIGTSAAHRTLATTLGARFVEVS